MPSLVQSSATLSAQPNNDCRQAFVMADSKVLAIYGSAGALHYKTSADGGATWSTQGNIAAAGALQAIVRNGNTLYLLTVNGGTLLATVLTYSSGTVTSGSSATLSTGVTAADAAWDASNSILHVVRTWNGGTLGQIGAWNPSTPTAQPAWMDFIAGGIALAGVNCVPGVSSTVFGTCFGSFNGISCIEVAQTTYSGGSYTTSVVERPVTAAITAAATSLNASNQLDIVYVTGGAVSTVTRVGSGVYAGPIPIIASGATGGLSLVTSGSDLILFVESVLNRSTGDIYSAWRQAGSWGAVSLAAGGDAAGYSTPKTAAGLTGGGYTLLYQRGGDVESGAGLQGHAPDAPTITAPSGAIGTLIPTVTGIYANSNAAGDTQSAAEYRVVRTSDSVVMWDSGKITATSINQVYGTGSNVSDPNYVAPTALSYGVQYAVQVRVWDSVLLPAQVSGWSTGVTFTPYQAGTTALTHLVQDGIDSTSAPVTIDSPTITGITGSWSQPQSHGADQVKATLYEPDLTTVVATLPAASIPGGLASGSSDTIGPWTIPGLANHSTYYLVLSYRDSVSLLWNDSAPWEIDTAWTPPPAPTLFTGIPQPQNGVTVLSWGNQGVYVSVVVQRALAGTGNWETLPKTGLFTALTDWPKLEVAYDYQVYGIDASGTESTPATATNVRLAANGIYGVWVTDSIYPAVQTCFGVVDQWEDATKLEHPDDSVKWRPLGGSKVIISFSLQDYAHGQRVFLVPTMGPDATGTILDQDLVVATLLALRKAHNPCLYRDIKGRFLYVALESPSDATANDKHPLDKVTWEMTEVQGVDGPLVV